MPALRGKLVASTLILAALSAFAGAAQGNDLEKIKAIYAQLDALTLKRDIPGLTKMLGRVTTKDCVFIGKPKAGGTVDKKTVDQTLKQMSTIMPMITSVPVSSTHVDKLRVVGTTATATVTSHLSMVTKPLQDGKPHKIVQTSTSVDTWTNAGGAWKLKESKTLTENATMDGKAIPGA